MNEYVKDSWGRALEALQLAKHDLSLSPDGAASRAYYAAFHAVSALFALEGKTFARHSAVETAVHRDLVKTGRWPTELGGYYSDLVELRTTGDYGGMEHVKKEEAKEAIRMAQAIIDAVQKDQPGLGEK